MLPGVSATFVSIALSPVLAGLVTLAAFGQSVLSEPSETAFHVCELSFSSVNDDGPIRLRYFLKMCVVPAPSRRTTGMIEDAELQPAPDSESPSSVIWVHFV